MTETANDSPWQPIETAPKDGTKIIVYGRHAQSPPSDGLIVTVGHYLNGLDCWVTTSGVMYDAIYWMPMPEPPAPAKLLPKRKTEENDNKGAFLNIIGGIQTSSLLKKTTRR